MADRPFRSQTSLFKSLFVFLHLTRLLPVADPGFPRGGGANPKCGGINQLFCPHFSEYCMKILKIGLAVWGVRFWTAFT